MSRVIKKSDLPSFVSGSPDRRRFQLALDTVARETDNLTGSEALAAGFVVLPAGYSQPGPSNHPDSEEVFYIVRGRGFVDLSDETQPIEAGSVIYIPAKTDHTIRNPDSDEELEWFFVNTPPLSREEYKPIMQGWERVSGR